jgi:hypothetical protein
MKDFARKMQQYHLYIPNSYKYILVVKVVHRRLCKIKCALHFGTQSRREYSYSVLHTLSISHNYQVGSVLPLSFINLYKIFFTYRHSLVQTSWFSLEAVYCGHDRQFLFHEFIESSWNSNLSSLDRICGMH